MRRYTKVLLGAAGMVGAVAAVLGFPAPNIFDSCENTRLVEARSPGATHVAVVFARDCGATTGFSTHVSLLRARERLANDGGNVFVSDTDHGRAPAGTSGGPDVQVLWKNEREVLIRHHPLVRVFRAETRRGDIHLRYERR